MCGFLYRFLTDVKVYVVYNLGFWGLGKYTECIIFEIRAGSGGGSAARSPRRFFCEFGIMRSGVMSVFVHFLDIQKRGIIHILWFYWGALRHYMCPPLHSPLPNPTFPQQSPHPRFSLFQPLNKTLNKPKTPKN